MQIDSSKRISTLGLLGVCSAFASSVQAGPANYVHMPSVEYGEREIELHLGTLKEPVDGRESAAVLYYGQGITPWWFSELGGELEKSSHQGTKLEAIEWENYFLINEPGEYAIDTGVLVETEFATEDDEGWELKIGPLLQTSSGRVQFNFNPLLERKFDTGERENTELVYEMQIKYRLKLSFEYGLQAFGELGQWNHWEDRADQTHKLGPAIFGKLAMDNHRAIKYDMALLIGLNDKTPDNTLRATVEYEF